MTPVEFGIRCPLEVSVKKTTGVPGKSSSLAVPRKSSAISSIPMMRSNR